MNNILDLNLQYAKVSEEEIKSLDSKVAKIHNDIKNKLGEGSEFTDWISWPKTYDKEEVEQIIAKVNELKARGITKLIVIGIGGSYLGSKSAIDFVKGHINLQNNIFFAGTEISSSKIKQIEKQIEGSKWGICVISKSGTTLEPSLAFRYFEKKLINKEKEAAKDLIVAVTDKEKGTLILLAKQKGYQTFVVPDGIGGRFSGITSVGLFVMAFAGLDIKKLLYGSEKAMNNLLKLENNLAYKYAVVRYILNTQKNLFAEWFIGYDTDLNMTLEWLKQLFGESEGKDGKGILPISALFSTDLHSLGQIIQDGVKNTFETTIWIKEDQDEIIVEENEDNFDGLNYLAGKSMHQINEQAFKGVVHAHAIEGGIPNILIMLKDKSEESLGYLWYFFFMSVTMSAYLNEVNPFNQPGVELYKKNMFANLKNNFSK